MAAKRTKARELAIQALYEADINREERHTAIDSLLYSSKLSDEAKQFGRELFEGVQTNRGEIDRLILECSTKWSLFRMGVVDRAILRLAGYELRFAGVPKAVVCSESVKLAHRFCDDESVPFINAMVDAMAEKVATGEVAVSG